MSIPGLIITKVYVIDHAATGAAMRSIRRRSRVSLRSLAKAMDVSVPFLSDLELGRRNWTTSNAAHYNRSLRTLIYER